MDVIPGRMGLLVTLFLVLVNIFNTVTTNTPKAEGLTAIEAWMLACILFVCGALFEWVSVLNMKIKFCSFLRGKESQTLMENFTLKFYSTFLGNLIPKNCLLRQSSGKINQHFNFFVSGTPPSSSGSSTMSQANIGLTWSYFARFDLLLIPCPCPLEALSSSMKALSIVLEHALCWGQ